MSSKTLARAGAALINRLFVSSTLEQSNAILLPQISRNSSAYSLLEKIQVDRTPPLLETDVGEAETLKRISSPVGILFPCSLPSLRFFIGEGKNRPIHETVVRDAETLKKIASPEGILFPCGLPSLQFFIDEGDDALSNDPLLLLPKRTYQPSHIKRKRTHGYLARKATKGGRKVIKRRIAKGRSRIAV